MSFLLPTLHAWASSRPYRPAVMDEAGAELTWAALPSRVMAESRRLAAQLQDLARPVAIQGDQGVAQTIADLALMELGVPVVVVPTFFLPAQRDHALAQCGAQALLRGEGTSLEVESWPGAAESALPVGTARISYTSGSTGTPRGLCLSAAHLREVARAVCARLGAAHGGMHLAILPPGLLLETVSGCHATLLAGGTYLAWSQAAVGLAQPFRPDFAMMADALASTRARTTILVPEYLAGLVCHLERSGLRLPALSLVAVGGARVAPSLLRRAAAVGLPVHQGYGLTECGSVVTLHDGDAQSAGSVGQSLGAHRVSIAADGEILVDGPLYLGSVGTPGRLPGPLATGDVGHFDAAGRLWIDGRKSHRIVTSFGRNVSPEWPESLLLESSAIAQCMVHGDDAAQLAALVVPAGPREAVDAAVAQANAQLPEYARIGSWRQVPPFTPANGLLTGNGRLRRAAIARIHLSEENTNAVL